MKKLLFVMLLLGGMCFGFTSCGGDDADSTEDAIEEVGDEIEDAGH